MLLVRNVGKAESFLEKYCRKEEIWQLRWNWEEFCLHFLFLLSQHGLLSLLSFSTLFLLPPPSQVNLSPFSLLALSISLISVYSQPPFFLLSVLLLSIRHFFSILSSSFFKPPLSLRCHQRVLNDLEKTFGSRMIWFLPHPLASLPSISLTRNRRLRKRDILLKGRGVGRNGGGAKSYDGVKSGPL